MQTIGSKKSGATRKSRAPARSCTIALLVSLASVGMPMTHAGTPDTARPAGDPAARAQRLFEAARAAFLESPTNATTAWHFGRACFDWAEFATNGAQRVAIAGDGVVACRAALRSNTNLAAAPYYLGMNLGQIARVKLFSALGLLDDMRDQFEAARRLDERFDEAGPDRNLGLLYRDAPGWPVSLGDRAKAEHHLARAVVLSPDYPENRLNLVESRLRWRQRTLAAEEIKALAALLPRARVAYTGEAWALSWEDWDRRWHEVQTRARKLGIETGKAPLGASSAASGGSAPKGDNKKAPR